jgi:hypothetical protein
LLLRRKLATRRLLLGLVERRFFFSRQFNDRLIVTNELAVHFGKVILHLGSVAGRSPVDPNNPAIY